MAKIIYAPEAKLEIKDAAVYYENCKERLGQAFLEAVEIAIEGILQNPLLWRRISSKFRRCLVKKFPYGIIYAVDEDEIFVAAVMHLKRKPEYWKKRIREKSKEE